MSSEQSQCYPQLLKSQPYARQPCDLSKGKAQRGKPSFTKALNKDIFDGRLAFRLLLNLPFPCGASQPLELNCHCHAHRHPHADLYFHAYSYSSADLYFHAFADPSAFAHALADPDFGACGHA
jgi:hypothetical protein